MGEAVRKPGLGASCDLITEVNPRDIPQRSMVILHLTSWDKGGFTVALQVK